MDFKNERREVNMSEGGFLVKFDDKKKTQKRCYVVAFDYDEWSYAINNTRKRNIPKGVKKITIEVEYEES